ncbi:hypothetical protein [Paenibacillus sp. BR1-192]|uniref:hypothetical protein n=1 Tax=Paenibacillus sp. BR1-192 TaxID=3032287 RepID=UPI00240E8DB4|nr:hypothetical protein [Paenibacillus sp. BR1-192]WFB57498.1 hypothetical protein P0X86_26570 [Paenibacillus sp. BR1-192]
MKLNRMQDPKVKAAIRLLQAKGITIKEIEEAYRYYDRIKEKPDNRSIVDLI